MMVILKLTDAFWTAVSYSQEFDATKDAVYILRVVKLFDGFVISPITNIIVGYWILP
jgi:hypothetical protein